MNINEVINLNTYGENVYIKDNIARTGITKQGATLEYILDSKIASFLSEHDLYTMTTNDCYGLWDELIETYGGESVVLGKAEDYEELRCYNFSARSAKINSGLESWCTTNQLKPTVYILAAIHGNEKNSSICLYLTFKKWLENKQNSEYIVNNYNFSIVPVGNPYGFTHNTRDNANGVNLNRNFPYGWNSYSGNDKGDSAMSETVTKLLYNWVNGAPYKNNTIVIDLHDHEYYAHDDKRVMWVVNRRPEIRNQLYKACSYCESLISKIYTDLDYSNSNYNFCDYQTFSTSPTFDYCAYRLGCVGSLIELPAEFDKGERYTEKTIDIGCIIVGNTIKNVCDYIATDYSGKCFTSLADAGMTNDMSLKEVIAQLPNGTSLRVNLSSSSTLKSDMPQYATNSENGQLIIHKNRTNGSNSCSLLWLTNSLSSGTKLFVSSANASGEVLPWYWVQNGVWTNKHCMQYSGKDNDSITLADLIDICTSDNIICVQVSTSYFTTVYNELGIDRNGVLTIKRNYLSDNYCLNFQPTNHPENYYQWSYANGAFTSKYKFTGEVM